MVGCRVYDKQLQNEGWYLGRLTGYGDVAVVGFDGEPEAVEMSFHDLRNLYR